MTAHSDKTDKTDKSEKIRITIDRQHSNDVQEIQARPGSNLWFLLRKHGIPIGSSCSGVGVCSACAVTLRAEDSTAASPETEFETATRQRNGIEDTKRIACLVRVWKPLTVICE